MEQHLIHLLSARTWGGTERYALDICRHFVAQGWKVAAFTRDARTVDSMLAGAGIKVRHAPFSGYSDLPTAFALAQALRRGEGRFVVHAHTYRDAFLALVARKLARRSPEQVRVVATFHRAREAKDGPLMRRIYRNVDAHIFISDLVRRRFLSTWGGEEAGHIPFRTDRFHTLGASILQAPEPKEMPEKGPATALYIGRLSPEKGIETLIRALAPLKGKRLRLCIAGTGYADYLDSLHRLAAREGVLDLIDWKGWVADVAPLLAAARFCVVPAIWEEPFSLASLESIAAARPVVFSSNGSQTEFLAPVAVDDLALHPEKAWEADSIAVPPGDSEALSRAMMLLSADLPQARMIGENGRRRFLETLDWPHFISQLIGIYTPL